MEHTRRRFLRSTGAATLGMAGLAGCSTLDIGSGGGVQPLGEDLTVWHAMGGGNGETLDRIGSDFEAETGVGVSMEYQGSYEDVLNNAFSGIDAGQLPDAIQVDSLFAQQVLDTGAFKPVEEILPDDYPTDDFLENVTNFFTIDGTLQSMPFNNSNAILYYNKDVFEEAGLDSESPPATLGEVQSYSQQIVDQGAAEYGITWPNHVWFIEHWFALDDQPIVDQENGRGGAATTVYSESDTAIEMWEWWKGMNEADLYSNPGIEAWGEAASTFYSQTAAMLLTSTASVAGAVSSAEEEGFELGTGFYPALGDRTGVPIGGASFWVPDGFTPDREEEIGRLLQFISDPERQVQWHQGTGYYPVRQTSVELLEDRGWFEENPHYATAFDQLTESEDTPASRRMLVGPARQVQVMLQEGSVEIFRGSTTVEDGAADIKDEAETELERYNEAQGES